MSKSTFKGSLLATTIIAGVTLATPAFAQNAPQPPAPVTPTDTQGNTPYLPGTFRLLSDGDHVVCAVTGARIPLHELKYWSVERQEPYVDAEASLKAEQRASGR